MIKISATIITYNEENNIERCLKSLIGVVDEIIVVDSFSSDKTVEICSKYNAKVYQNPFESYGVQKNFATKKASYDWILSLDADEELSEELRSSILVFKQNAKMNAYTFSRITNFCGKWIKYGGWYPDTQLRFWNKQCGSWNNAKVHERIELEENTTIGKLKGDLLHYSYYTIDEYLHQINKYSNLKAEDLLRKGKKANIFTLIFKPFFKFFVLYFIQRGIMDGYYGFVIAISASYATFLNYVKLKHKLKVKQFESKDS